MEDIVVRLRKRAQIRRSISDRRSVQEGLPDRIADILDEAAETIEELRKTDTPDIWSEHYQRGMHY